MPTPRSTYRLQLHAGFTLDDAVAVVPQLAGLGVTHLYLSPLLAAVPGSTHGYDVIDHARIDDDRGGLEGLRRLSESAHAHGLGLVLDVVPNHMSVEIPKLNAPWWDLLTHGSGSRYASWFDVEWDTGPILIPVLGAAGDVTELTISDDELHYFDHVFPISPGTGIGTPQEIHERQHYRLVDWRLGSTKLNYRRFFDVTTLAAIRVEDEQVYAASHALVLDLVRSGTVDGLRIDHPDGLTDPGGYLEWLARDAPGAWIVVEKILEPGERLPRGWPVAGTTGYDAARLVTGIFVDPAGLPVLSDVYRRHAELDPQFEPLVVEGKREAATTLLAAEIARLARQASDTSGAVEAITEIATAMPVYRSYLPGPGKKDLEAALDRAGEARPDLAGALRTLRPRLSDGADPLCVRFQQTSGMIMAKGVEDTAFYRHHLLLALNEVGGDPARFGVGPEEWHAECTHLAEAWPESMTLLSSHDTKRSEDVRARLVLLSQVPDRWSAVVQDLRAAAVPYLGQVAPDDAYLLHQTLAGTGPIAPERVGDYLRKATREAKRHTSWLDPDEAYDADLQALVRGVLADETYVSILAELHRDLDGAWRTTVLAQKLAQLTMPGVPDLYQGSERILISLVDPDNRREPDWKAPEEPKTALVRTVLTLRRDRPELFAGYASFDTGTADLLGYTRSPDLLVLIRRFATRPVPEIALPEGTWTDALSGRTGVAAASSAEWPGALLVRES